MTDPMISTRQANDGSAVIEIHGEIDMSSAPRLWQLLVDTAERRPSRVVVGLQHLTFIDSTGIGALVAGRNAAQAVGVGFSVRDPSPFVTRQLRLTGLYDTLVGGGQAPSPP